MNNQHLSWHIDCPVCNPARAKQMSERAANYGRWKEEKEMINEICRTCRNVVYNEVGREVGCGELNVLIQNEITECEYRVEVE